ncbi:phage tail tube protein [Listeria booriae]|uniref:phage tail tube protein n=1 Tax=Listeria booriae TaxID=1552123 RepID=UPI001627D096|nr:Ig-like domain-containing protein [Listeria booriae]
MVVKSYFKNFLRRHYVGEITENGEYSEDNLLLLAAGVSTVDVDTDEDTEDYEYYDGNGGKETETTSSSLNHQFSGNRKYGDPALDFVRSKLIKTSDRTVSFKVVEPDGTILKGLATITELKPYGGDANTRAEMEFTITFLGQPTEVLAGEAEPESVSVTSDTITIAEDETAQITATVAPAEANQEVTYTSENISIASVDNKGLVTGNLAGATTITVASASKPSVTTVINVTVTD